MIYRLGTFASCIPLASFCCCALGLIGIALNKYQNNFTKVYIVGSGVLALTSGVIITYAFRYVLKHLEAHISNFDQTSPELQTAYKRIKRDYYVSGSISVIVGCICVAFGGFNYLWKQSHYVLTFVKLILPLSAPIPIMENFKSKITQVHTYGAEEHQVDDTISPDLSSSITTVIGSLTLKAYTNSFFVIQAPSSTSRRIVPVSVE
jgi:predicted PurR-regulated permease PerM